MGPEIHSVLRLMNFDYRYIINCSEVNRRIKVLLDFCLINNCRVIRCDRVKINPAIFIISPVLYIDNSQSYITEDLAALGLRYYGDRILMPRALIINIQLSSYLIDAESDASERSLSWVINPVIECRHQDFISETNRLSPGELREHRVALHKLICSVIRSEEEFEFYQKFLALTDWAYINIPQLYL